MNHAKNRYGLPLERVIDTQAQVELPTPDNWKKGNFERAVNQSGLYGHRFRVDPATKVHSFADVVRNIANESGKSVQNKVATLPRCATFIGPSACRLYGHNSWKFSAGFLFSPSTHTSLAYKGDLYCNRPFHPVFPLRVNSLKLSVFQLSTRKSNANANPPS